MASKDELVAVISPWSKLSELVRANFRVETLPAERKVMVWREDLKTAQALLDELGRLGVQSPEIRKGSVTAAWQEIK